MKENSDKNSALIRSKSQSLAKAENSIRVTDRILNEIQSSNWAWWNGLSREWQETLYLNYRIVYGFRKFPNKLDDFNVNLKVLEKILQFNKIEFRNNPFTDYSPLNRLHNLIRLDLDNKFCDLNLVNSVIPHIEILNISNTNVKSIEPLTEAKSLSTLYIDSTNVTDISHLQGLENIERFSCDSTEVSNINTLISISDCLRHLNISHCPIGNEAIPTLEKLDLKFLNIANTNIDNLSFVKNYSDLRNLLMEKTPIKDISPLFNFESLYQLRCSGRERYNHPSKLTKQMIELREINPECNITYRRRLYNESSPLLKETLKF